MAFKDELLGHLRRFAPAPFLFVGAGISRRYLGSDGWEELLRRYAAEAGQPYEYYASSADQDLPRIASLIATDLHEPWWKDERFEASRKYFEGQSGGSQWALKAEISKDLADELDRLPKRDALAEELNRLRSAVVDGVITTNYDALLEHVFPDFEVFVGQDQMLFAQPQGIGEIYKIHGSVEAPNSLVLTAEDYSHFNERNAYLAAKLLTVFVEHPVIFIGYSISDENVFAVLRSIASILTKEKIQELQDRLIFIQWDESADEPKLSPIPFVADGYTIPMLGATVSDYDELFEVLGSLERRFPARVLRQLKERVYELVQTNDPKQKLFVQDLDADVDANNVDVVLGVGAIDKQLEQSYKGLGRSDLAEDVLKDDRNFDALRVVTEVLPTISRNTHVPVFKYLREAGLLEDDGELRSEMVIDPRVTARVESFGDHFRIPSGYEKRAAVAINQAGDFAGLTANCDPRDVLIYAGALDRDKQDPAALRRFLLDHRRPESGDETFFRTQWYRGVCLYDWLQYSKRPKPARRRRPRGKRPG